MPLGAGAMVVAGLVALLAWPMSARAAWCEGDLPGLPPEPAADAPKFQLAEAACGPLGRAPASDGAVEPTARPRVAEQMRLYRAVPAEQSLPRVDMPAASEVIRPPRRAASRGSAPSSTGAVARIVALVPAVTEVARRFGIDPLLLHAVAHVESRHQPSAQSSAGARGMLQVMPDTARRFGLDDPRRELLEPSLNLQVGAEYLKTLQQRFGNDLALVLAAYNAGEGAVEKYGRRVPPYPETQAYVRDVLATYAELRRRVGSVSVAGSV